MFFDLCEKIDTGLMHRNWSKMNEFRIEMSSTVKSIDNETVGTTGCGSRKSGKVRLR